ncbi:MAG TPA: hypothetical protein VGJ94_10935 [Syntrophorhabdaceae bacterium]|jgi:hypothetical protein
MDAVTYPNEEVSEFISRNFVPLKLRFDAQPFAADFNVKWTPTMIVIDQEGREHMRSVGFLPPDELIPSLLLGMAKVFFDSDRFPEALPILEKVLFSFPKSGAAPEAAYLQGVAGFKGSHDPQFLKRAYEKLLSDYPGSEWVNRASPYRLL